MKKILFSLSLIGSFAASAATSEIDASAQIFGCLPITTSAQSVIVCVPWIAASNGTESPISVADIIKTAGLTEGDTIRVWSGTLFNVWKLVQNTSTGILEWEKTTTINADGTTGSAESSDVTLNRGDALILKRKVKPTQSYTFYVYGQYSSSSAGATTMAKGDADAPAYTLVAPPIVSGTYTVHGLNWSNYTGLPRGRSGGDFIVIGDTGAEYYLNDLDTTGAFSFGKRKINGTWKQFDGTINAGIGFWYVSRGGQPTITWSN